METIRLPWLMLLASALLAACGGDDLAGPAEGSIRVTVTTSGDQPDADGYLVAVDGAGGERIGASAVSTFTNIPAGSHQVTLSDLAENCMAAGELSRTITVEAGATASLAFDIACAAASGGLRLVTSTNGTAPDPDGYQASLDGGSPVALPTSGEVLVGSVAQGDHLLAVSGLAPNCALDGPNPRSITVAAGAVLTVDLAITCGPPVGSLIIVTATAGLRPDLDGYEVRIRSEPAQPIGANASLTVSGLPAGEVTVGLSGVAPNCALAGDNPRTATVSNGNSTQLRFEVSCLPTGEGVILFTSDRTGTSHLFRVRDDDSRLVDLTPAAGGCCGDWSPDGSRIVFSADAGVTVMNEDGSSPVPLGVSGGGPRWSPDGRKILFTQSSGNFGTDGTIQVMNVDGSGATTLTTGRSPDWSADGTRIVFERTGACVVDICPADIYVMAADGSQLRKLTNSQSFFDFYGHPAWSPDGGKIAYRRSRYGNGGLYTMNPDGSGQAQITGMGGSGRPVWSPDGSAFAVAVVGTDGSSTELMVLPSSGGAGVVLASSPGFEYPDSWK